VAVPATTAYLLSSGFASIFLQFMSPFRPFVATVLKLTCSLHTVTLRNQNRMETQMKNVYANTSNLKDTVTAGALLAAMFVGIVGSAFASLDAHASAPAMASEKLETIVITAPRMGVERLDTIVVTASRNSAA
jgi:hypothetical protein